MQKHQNARNPNPQVTSLKEGDESLASCVEHTFNIIIEEDPKGKYVLIKTQKHTVHQIDMKKINSTLQVGEELWLAPPEYVL